MSLCVPTLRVIVGLGLVALAAAAEDQAVDRTVRQQESSQRAIASQTISTSKQITEMADEYTFNHLGDDSQATALRDVAKDLTRLSDPASAGKDHTMQWVGSRLAASRTGADTKGELDKASSGQGEIIAAMATILKNAESKFGAMEQRQDLQDIIDQQQKLAQETQKLAEQTVGKDKKDLTAQQKIDQDRIASQQQQLKDKLTQAASELKQAAEKMQSQDPQTAQRLEQSANQLQQQQLDKNMQQASDAVRDNKMQAAQEQQKQVLDKLNQAQNALQQMNQAQQPETMAQIDQKLNKLEQLSQQQKDLLSAASHMKPDAKAEEFNQLEAQQRDLNADMQDQKMSPEAQKHAQKAADELQNMKQQPAAEAMQKALDDLDKQAKELQDKLAKMQSKQTDSKPQKSPKTDKPPAGSALQQSDLAKKNGSSWQVSGQEQARETLTNEAGEKFPHKYEQALSQYYRDLAAGDDTSAGH